MRNLRRFGLWFTTLYFVAFFVIISNADTGYAIYNNDGEDNIYVEVGIETIKFTQQEMPSLFDNLVFERKSKSYHHQFELEEQDQTEMVKKVREYLLLYGYAKLENISIADDYEVEAQWQAQNSKIGIWDGKEGETGADETGASSGKESEALEKNTFWQKVKKYIASNHIALLSILVPLIFGGSFLSYIYKRILTRKRTIFIAGATSTGKTVFKNVLIRPDLSTAEIYNSEQTRVTDTRRIIRDFQNEKITLEAIAIDPPGGSLNEIIDNLVKKHKNKYIIVLMMAPTRKNNIKNDINREFVDEQMQVIRNLWCPLINSKSLKKPLSLIMFINKMDLYDNREQIENIFRRPISELKEACRSKNIETKVILGSMVNRTGIESVLDVIKGGKR